MKLKVVSMTVACAAVCFLGSTLEAGSFGHSVGIEKGSGPRITEERDLPPFERIKLKGSADSYITAGEEQSVAVITEENLLDNVITRVAARRTLVIESEGSFTTRRDVKVEISVPRLEQLMVSGSGDVEIYNLKEESFEIRLSGSGDIDVQGDVDRLEVTVSGSGAIRLEGSTERLDISVRGSGDVDARDLIAEEAEVTVTGSGDVAVHATSSFDGSVSGSGDIDVYGNPRDWSRHVSGSGDIHRRR